MCASIAYAQSPIQTSKMPLDQPWSVRMANSYIDRHPGAVTYDSASPKQSWDYEQGLMLEAFHQLWLKTGDQKYFDFIKNTIDFYKLLF